MAWFPFKFKKTPKSFLGIDIGASAIRVVELSRRGRQIQLENYGEVKSADLKNTPFRKMPGDALSLHARESSQVISAILKEANIKTREVNFSIPDFSTFFTSFELPPMSEEELKQAVRYEARSYVPLPLSEVTLDWQLINGGKVLVAAFPNDALSQFQEIASICGLEVKELEAEVFALGRALVKKDEGAVVVLDLGARSTTCNIFEAGNLKMSHSFNVSGNEFTEVLSRALKIDYPSAEQLKIDQGLIPFEGAERNTRDILLPLVDSILAETKKTLRSFLQQDGREVKKTILAGGSALLPGLSDYFFEELNSDKKQEEVEKIKVEVANPFVQITFQQILADMLKTMGPSYTIAVGLAMKGLEIRD